MLRTLGWLPHAFPEQWVRSLWTCWWSPPWLGLPGHGRGHHNHTSKVVAELCRVQGGKSAACMPCLILLVSLSYMRKSFFLFTFCFPASHAWTQISWTFASYFGSGLFQGVPFPSWAWVMWPYSSIWLCFLHGWICHFISLTHTDWYKT